MLAASTNTIGFLPAARASAAFARAFFKDAASSSRAASREHCGVTPERLSRAAGLDELLPWTRAAARQQQRRAGTPRGLQVYFFSQAAKASAKARSPAGPFSMARMARLPLM